MDCAAADIVFRDGTIAPRHAPQTAVPFIRLAANPHWAPGLLPRDIEPGLRETVFWSPESLTPPDGQDRINTSAAYGFVFDVCAVEVDRETGRVRIDRYVTTHDAGRILNPALADGQIRGAYAQGLGAALMEGVALWRGRQLPVGHLRRLSGAHDLRSARAGHPAHGNAQPLHAPWVPRAWERATT